MDATTKVSLNKTQLRNGVKAIRSTMYGQNGGLLRDRKNRDVEIAVKNLTEHDMSQVKLATAIKAVTVDGASVNPRPNNWDHDAITLRDDVVSQFVEAYFDQ